MSIENWLTVLLLVVGVGLVVYSLWKLGWKLPRSLDDLKEAGPAAMVGGLILLLFVAVVAAKISTGSKLAKADKKHAAYEEEKGKFNIRVDAQGQEVREAQGDAMVAAKLADAAEDDARRAEAEADALTTDAGDAHERAEDALERANRIRDERAG